MGLASAAKYLKNVLGIATEQPAIYTSDGAADGDKIVATDPTTGRLHASIMPAGIAADTNSAVASEAIAAGDAVNVWNDAGTAKIRLADASAVGKEAHGFVTAAVASGASGTVYGEGTNAMVTGLTPGMQYLSATTPGKMVSTPPSGAGQVVQRLGVAYSATEMNFEASPPIALAA